MYVRVYKNKKNTHNYYHPRSLAGRSGWHWHGERGSITGFVAVVAFALVMVAGMAYDGGQVIHAHNAARNDAEQAARAGALAAWLAARGGDRIAALRGSHREAPVPPASGARGALRVLDALVRWYAQAPADDDGLTVALEHARRLLRPGSRLVLLADPSSISAVPAERWPALAMHHELIVLLFVDPLETSPPAKHLAFLGAQGDRIELGLDTAPVRQRWKQHFDIPLDATQAMLQRQGARVMVLSTVDPSDAWLSLLGRPHAMVAAGVGR